jgi:Domain of unknown function(DUF2779)
MAYFTKSRFKLALDCPTKLYYGANKDYANQKVDDPFLMALAEGGFQVGELAKYMFSADPIAEDITINDLDSKKALELTALKRAKGGKVVIAEAAFNYENFLVRTDLIVEEGNIIKLYEVKAKSWDDKVVFLKTDKKGEISIVSKWAAYLYDVAFQKWVVSKANPGKEVRAHLVLVDKTKEATIDGLNQVFRLKKDGNKNSVEVDEHITSGDLGYIPLKVLNVEDACTWIYSNPVDINLKGSWKFEDLIYFLDESLQKEEKIEAAVVSTTCKTCEFKNDDNSAGSKKSGFHECWKHLASFGDDDFKQDLILELWGGSSGSISHVNNAIAQDIFQLKHLAESHYTPKKEAELKPGLSATQRRTIQIQKSKANDYTPYIDREGLKEIFETYPAPYHFIDFETTMVAIPFHKDRRPYEAIAFQYSYHLMDEKCNISHENQYLSFDKGVFHNYNFLRELKRDLSGKPGTVFRYHNHENTYLNHIYKQLQVETNSTVPDKEELIAFIQEISHSSKDTAGNWQPVNEMKDLFQLVISYFYSLYAKGSNSIKDILPAVIQSSPYIRDKYSKPIYGTSVMPSLNFKEPHNWISEATGFNPYETLPVLFTDLDKINFDLSDSDMDELSNGGAAMMAYAHLQFTNLPEERREKYRNGLLRYCELDTLAMVMIWDYWGKGNRSVVIRLTFYR